MSSRPLFLTYIWEGFVTQDFAADRYLGDVAPLPSATQVLWKSQCFRQLQAIGLSNRALLRTTRLRLHLVIPPDSVQHRETLEWRFPGVQSHVQHDAGHIQARHDRMCWP